MNIMEFVRGRVPRASLARWPEVKPADFCEKQPTTCGVQYMNPSDLHLGRDSRETMKCGPMQGGGLREKFIVVGSGISEKGVFLERGERSKAKSEDILAQSNVSDETSQFNAENQLSSEQSAMEGRSRASRVATLCAAAVLLGCSTSGEYASLGTAKERNCRIIDSRRSDAGQKANLLTI